MRAPLGTAMIIGAALLVGACGDRSGKILDDPIFPPPDTTVETVVDGAVVAPSLPPTTIPAAQLTLVAPWVDGAEVPARNTCAGDGFSPALSWANVPPGTAELAITVVDLDADQFVHWIVYGIGNGEVGVLEGLVPNGAFEWPNSSGRSAWAPLCPPAGETHRYQFTVHALNQQLEVADDASATEVLSIVNATSIELSSVSGLTTGSG